MAAKAPWLPRWLSFLSGLPEPKRKRRYIVIIQAYADDSGVNDGKSRTLVIAALIQRAEHWARFSDEWAACLQQSPTIKRFKMKEAAGLSGQFYGLSESERDAKLVSLARIINRCGPVLAVSRMNLAAHAKTLELPWEPFGRDPYWMPFHSIILEVAKHLWDHGVREKFEFIFDEQVTFGLRAKSWYPAMRNASKVWNPAAFAILPVEPVFRSDDDTLPIQAADLFAWCFRHGADNEGKGELHPFGWLVSELKKVRRIEAISSFDDAVISNILAESAAMERRAWTEAEIQGQKTWLEDTKNHPKRKQKPKKKR